MSEVVKTIQLVQILLDEDFLGWDGFSRQSITQFQDMDGFLRSQIQPDAIIIGSHEAESAERVIRQLRSIPAFCCIPVFLLTDLGPTPAMMADAQTTDLNTIVNQTITLTRRLKDLPDEILTQGQDLRLLAYLYCRQAAVLSAVAHWSHQKVYSFPVAELLADSTTDIQTWLNNLVERRYLERVELLDRIRLCPKCGGCHHNFVDVCPQNRSIDIVQKPFLHCFTCGHVAPEETFLSSGALVCPNCMTRLRHIGSDYDRPLENYVCNDCGHSFIEPLIVSRCLSCGSQNSTESLIPRQIYSLRLTERGRMAAQTGNMEDLFALFDNLNYVAPPFFHTILDWMLALCRRHAEERFSLIGIRVVNILELIERIGRHRMGELLDEFALRLREAIRTTDLTTRTSQWVLWLLLPKTDTAGCEVLVQRLRDIAKNSQQPEGVGIEIGMVSFSAPSDIINEEPAALLLQRLMAAME
ncbi:MAG: diguanylate cyclase domain-containing protein [Syntrophobacteraceae bacterium]